MPTQGLATSYDEVPYPWLCYRPSHPSHLFVCATLLGLSPAPAETCRVLELGCALGGNLLPMAASLPGASFVGIDLSPAQIASGQQAVDALGLRNVSLQTKDLSDVTPALGTFDYIIAHGIYSWVPPTVRDHLLRVCHENLAPNGVAYVSYNTLPGWHMILSLREMMLHHARTATDPLAQAALARELIAFLAEATADEDNPIEGTLMGAWRSILRVQNGDPRQQVDAALLHDELAQWNDPVYFYQFVEHAGAHGLQFLVEADWHLSVLDNLPAAVASRILDMSTN
ncbi:MAG: methyltransferase domain-containing protein, partial [Chloroflexi bacterium]|nr:methyltransferase domain-containing protein [Chloroflexota bacterium]